jgi:hypothetical protein
MVVFQYNPEMLSRTIAPQYISADKGGRPDKVRFKSAAVEQITAQIEIDGTDLLSQGDSQTLAKGIHPQLATLMLLAYPSTQYVNSVASQLKSAGTLKIIPAAAPLTLFVWGALRVVPVRIDSIDIAEQAYDPLLNPIRATVSLKMTVLTYSDFPVDDPAFTASVAYQQVLEGLALKISPG